MHAVPAPVGNPPLLAGGEAEGECRDGELEEMESQLVSAVRSIETFHVQQKELFDNFVALRKKYDGSKERLCAALFEHLPRHSLRYKHIPPVRAGVERPEGRLGTKTCAYYSPVAGAMYLNLVEQMSTHGDIIRE